MDLDPKVAAIIIPSVFVLGLVAKFVADIIFKAQASKAAKAVTEAAESDPQAVTKFFEKAKENGLKIDRIDKRLEAIEELCESIWKIHDVRDDSGRPVWYENREMKREQVDLMRKHAEHLIKLHGALEGLREAVRK